MSVDPAVIEGLHDELRRHLAEFTASDAWLNWLHGARQFHRYSPNNQLLLMLQGADGHVASYRTWQRIPAVGGGHCQVRKGEHGLTILAPLTLTRRDIDEASGDEIVVASAVRGFRTVKVFHQGQLVAPPDLPERPLPRLLTGEDRWQHVWAAVVAQLADEGYPVELHTARPGETWNGRTHFDTGHVEIMDHLDPPQRLKTLVHEWAHITLRHGDPDRPATRELMEIEAESVAYLLCRTIDLQSSSYSIPYLAGWAGGDLELAEATAQRILTATATMVDTVETRLSIDLTPDLFSATRPAPAPPSTTPAVTDLAAGLHPRSATVTDLRPDRAGAARAGLTAPYEFDPAPIDPNAPPALHDALERLATWDRAVLLTSCARLDRADDRRVAVALCADAGLDTAATAAALTGVGADPGELRRTMKQATIVNDEGERRCMFDNVDAAFRVGDRPPGLDVETAARLEQLDVDDVEHVERAVSILRTDGQYRPNEIAQVLTYLGVARTDAAATHSSSSPSDRGRPADASCVRPDRR